MKSLSTLLLNIFFLANLFAQSNFNFDIALEPITVPNMPGLHSYAFGQHNGKWLIIGGRKDGLHARQPFNAFPQNNNNTNIYVVDIENKQVWSANLSTLPINVQEQLQSTNMNFYQDKDSLYIIGGYAFSTSANDHKTFDKMTSIIVSSTIDAIINSTSFNSYFKQITDNNFAITGGQLGKIGDTFYLVGGHRFDGRYNPMGNATYTQTYSNQIRKFKINNSGNQLSISNYTAITDAVHLRRRDYNLLPQIFPDGTEGYTISSGVFQINADLPFLYPVDIKANSYTPITSFNQYLSNYHSAKVCMYDSINNEMHSLFFGGMSQYYYQNGTLIQDNGVPFVKTISLLTRFSDGTLQEFQMPEEMPALKGASAEFIPNMNIPHYDSEIIKIDKISDDTIMVGYIYGGIDSPSLNPFANNQTNTTSAATSVYKVKLIRNKPLSKQNINGNNPYSVKSYPNPTKGRITVEFETDKPLNSHYFITNLNGQIIQEGKFLEKNAGLQKHDILIDKKFSKQMLFLTIVIDNKYYSSNKIVVE